MRKAKKLIVLAIVSVMLFGMALTAHAATFNYVPSNHHCLNSICGWAPLKQDSYAPFHWYCPDSRCGWDYYEF